MDSELTDQNTMSQDGAAKANTTSCLQAQGSTEWALKMLSGWLSQSREGRGGKEMPQMPAVTPNGHQFQAWQGALGLSLPAAYIWTTCLRPSGPPPSWHFLQLTLSGVGGASAMQLNLYKSPGQPRLPGPCPQSHGC